MAIYQVEKLPARRDPWLTAFFSMLFSPFAVMLWYGRGWMAILFGLVELALILLLPALYAAGYAVNGSISISLFPYLVQLFLTIVLLFVVFMFGHPARERWYSRWYLSLIAAPVVFLSILLLLFESFAFKNFTISSKSMLPQLAVGDHVLVSKFAYGYGRYSFPFGLKSSTERIFPKLPERGNVVVFRLEDHQSTHLKRIVGMPGETIEVRNGIVFVDGVDLQQKELEPSEILPIEALVDHKGSAKLNYSREHLPNGRNYVVMDLVVHSEGDNAGPFQVPVGHYFMIGDNRDYSVDSRFDLGVVPFENLIGKVVLIYWNDENIPPNNRLDGFTNE